MYATFGLFCFVPMRGQGAGSGESTETYSCFLGTLKFRRLVVFFGRGFIFYPCVGCCLHRLLCVSFLRKVNMWVKPLLTLFVFMRE